MTILKGLYYWDQFTPESLQQALEYFNKAIETDPEWALPYMGTGTRYEALHDSARFLAILDSMNLPHPRKP